MERWRDRKGYQFLRAAMSIPATFRVRDTLERRDRGDHTKGARRLQQLGASAVNRLYDEAAATLGPRYWRTTIQQLIPECNDNGELDIEMQAWRTGT